MKKNKHTSKAQKKCSTVPDGNDPPSEKIKPKQLHTMIPNSVLRTQMGEDRWQQMIDYIADKHGTRKIYLGYHRVNGGAEIYLRENDKHLGNVAEVERLAKKATKEISHA